MASNKSKEDVLKECEKKEIREENYNEDFAIKKGKKYKWQVKKIKRH